MATAVYGNFCNAGASYGLSFNCQGQDCDTFRGFSSVNCSIQAGQATLYCTNDRSCDNVNYTNTFYSRYPGYDQVGNGYDYITSQGTTWAFLSSDYVPQNYSTKPHMRRTDKRARDRSRRGSRPAKGAQIMSALRKSFSDPSSQAVASQSLYQGIADTIDSVYKQQGLATPGNVYDLLVNHFLAQTASAVDGLADDLNNCDYQGFFSNAAHDIITDFAGDVGNSFIPATNGLAMLLYTMSHVATNAGISAMYNIAGNLNTLGGSSACSSSTTSNTHTSTTSTYAPICTATTIQKTSISTTPPITPWPAATHGPNLVVDSDFDAFGAGLPMPGPWSPYSDGNPVPSIVQDNPYDQSNVVKLAPFGENYFNYSIIQTMNQPDGPYNGIAQSLKYRFANVHQGPCTVFMGYVSLSVMLVATATEAMCTYATATWTTVAPPTQTPGGSFSPSGVQYYDILQVGAYCNRSTGSAVVYIDDILFETYLEPPTQCKLHIPGLPHLSQSSKYPRGENYYAPEIDSTEEIMNRTLSEDRQQNQIEADSTATVRTSDSSYECMPVCGTLNQAHADSTSTVGRQWKCPNALQDFPIETNCVQHAPCEMNAKGLAILKSFEKVCPTTYEIRGDDTIGWGHDCTKNREDCNAQYNPPITLGEAYNILNSDLSTTTRQLKAKFGKAAIASLNTNQFSALLDFAYNAGAGTAHQKFGSYVEAGNIARMCEAIAKYPDADRNRMAADSQLCNTPSSTSSGC